MKDEIKNVQISIVSEKDNISEIQVLNIKRALYEIKNKYPELYIIFMDDEHGETIR